MESSGVMEYRANANAGLMIGGHQYTMSSCMSIFEAQRCPISKVLINIYCRSRRSLSRCYLSASHSYVVDTWILQRLRDRGRCWVGGVRKEDVSSAQSKLLRDRRVEERGKRKEVNGM